jgi:hypothetical protein
VQGNYIGTDASGINPLGNSGSGVYISQSSNNSIGGTVSGAGNVIAFNGTNGVTVASGTGNAIRRNSIHDHGSGLGIDIGDDGVTLTNLANIGTATSSDTATTVVGSFDGSPDTLYTLEFFANTVANPSGYGEGERLLGTRNILTDDIGHDDYTFIFNTPVPAGQFVSATATDPGNTTWEFAADVVVNSAGRDAPSSLHNLPAVVALANERPDHSQIASWKTPAPATDGFSHALLPNSWLEPPFLTGYDSSGSDVADGLAAVHRDRVPGANFDMLQDLHGLLSPAVVDVLALNLLA